MEAKILLGIYSLSTHKTIHNKNNTKNPPPIETGGDLDSTKYLFKNLYTRYIRQKHKQGLNKGYSKADLKPLSD